MSLPLHARAAELGRALPPLLAQAQALVRAAMPGEHGRRRTGPGDEFWQYRAARAGDPARSIDWRRSARSDALFVREHEWQAAQSVTLWVDAGRSMEYAGDRRRPSKGERARLLGLALAMLLLRAGERVGLAGAQEPPRTGEAQGPRLARALEDAAAASAREHDLPDLSGLRPHGWAVMISDFLAPEATLHEAVLQAADAGCRGALLQVLDPVEEAFPFAGRVVFETMTGSIRHETREAGALRARYLSELASRRERLAGLCRSIGWAFSTHHTGGPAQPALLWLGQALGGGR